MEPQEIMMPQLSDSMEEGTILSWLVDEGQKVSEGDELVELETDKAAMTYEAEAEGVLQIVAAEGDTVAVGELIAKLGGPVNEDEEPVSTEGADAPGRVAVGPAREDATESDEGGMPDTGIPAGSNSSNGGPGESEPRERRVATPLAKRIASAHGVEVSELEGSGPRGRVTKSDVLQAAGIVDATPAPATPSGTPVSSNQTVSRAESGGDSGGSGAKGSSHQVELTRFQNVVARRMAEAKATIPHYQVQTDVDMDAAIELRSGFKAIGDGSAAPSFNDMIVKSSALALREFPQVNGSYQTGTFVLFERINIGIAVAGEDTLVVPTIVDADQKTLSQIKSDSKDLAERVRTGKVTPPELAGGTFTVSNLGMYGMTAIFPVINPPQAAILGVGAMRDTLRRGKDGEVVDGSILTLTLSCDHRILNGADASSFLFLVKANLEQPLKLTL